MTTDKESMTANTNRLFDLLIKATRTADENEAKQWWNYFYENLDPYQQHKKQSSKKKYCFSLFNRQVSNLNKTIQGLAQQLDKDNLSVLHYAGYHNNLFICRKLTSTDCDFNTSGVNGETILHIVARSKLIDKITAEQQEQSLLDYLLSALTSKRKPLVNIGKHDDQGRTALHHAVMTNRIANVKLLLDYQACIAAKDIRQATPLHYACRFNQTIDIVRLLLLKSHTLKFQSNKYNWMGQSASHKTCFPIRSKLDYINAKTRDGHDAFSLTRLYDHELILDELFKHLPYDDLRREENDQRIFKQIYKAILNEDFDYLNSYPNWFVINENTGETILHIACTLGCSNTLLYLLQRQDSFNSHEPNAIYIREKSHGFTPILSATYAGQAQCFEYMLNIIIKLLMKNNFRKNFLQDLLFDRYNQNLLHICILSRQTKLFEILFLTIESNPFLFVEFIEPMLFGLDYNDETPLHLAVRLNLHHMCKYLLKYSNRLDEIQQPSIYLNKIDDSELIRAIENQNLMMPTFNPSHVYIIAYKNRHGQSSFHISIQYGYKHLMNLFLEHVDQYGRDYLLEHTDADVRTPLHLASLQGYIEIVQELFRLHVNVYARDNQESTALHCVAKCVNKKWLNDNDVSVCILEIFLNYIQNCKNTSFDLLTALDGFSHNCLETAIISHNRSFVEYLLNLNNIPLFKNLLRNAQFIDIHYHHIDTPLRKLITSMPDIAYRVLDICITYIGEKHKIIYDFQFLEDHCSIQQWQHGNTSQTVKTKPIHKFYCLLFCQHKPVEFRSEYQHEPLIAYTADPYILVHNNALSVMCKCAKQIDLKDHEGEDEEETNAKHIQHSYKLMHHPLCKKLMHIKWREFGFPLFFISFITYCIYLILFTTLMLKNKQPEYFYRLVNADFPDQYDTNATELTCIQVAQRLVRLNIQEAMKQPIDRVLRILVIILLWIHVVKNTLLIVGVHRLSLVWRVYMEIATVILSFICLYDDDHWQNVLKFRCPIQWQIGAFGVFLAWTTLLSYLRFLPIFGVYVVMLEVIMLKFLWFAPVLVVLICSFSSAFYMLLQNQPVFSTIPFAWFRSAFMVMDTGYEDRFFGPDSDSYISLYPVLFIIFLLFGVTMTILVNNLLTALAVGEIADLSAIARVRNATRRYELLREWEIFRLQFLWKPAPIHIRHEHIEKRWNRKLDKYLKYIYRYTFLKSND